MSVHIQATLDRIHGPHNWSPMQPWPGGERPIPKDAVSEITMKNGKTEVSLAGGQAWTHCDHHTDTVGYRVHVSEVEPSSE